MNSFEGLIYSAYLIEEKLGYIFKDKRLLALAFVHRSFVNENRGAIDEHNERLEFLGDSVLGLLVSHYLYKNLPGHPEGVLSLLRSQIVDAGACAHYLNALGVSKYILLGKGEKSNQGRGRETLNADLFEALIGAIYLDGGIEEAKKFFFAHFTNDLEKIIHAPVRNWKAELQDYSQKRYQRPPVYKVLKEVGPDHGKEFHIAVFIDDREVGTGVGLSKKEAEQAAASDALGRIEEKIT